MTTTDSIIDSGTTSSPVGTDKQCPGIALRRAGAGLLAILWLLPPILIVCFMCRFAVDLPVWDDYTIGDTVHNAVVHGFTLQGLVAQHNESRPAFPRLLFLLLDLPTQWDVRYQVAASFVVIFCTGLLMLRVCRETIDNPLVALVVAVLVNFMLFSPVQWENLLWGIQLIVFIPALALVIAMHCLSRPGKWYLWLPVSAVAATVATFSNSNGMLIWMLAVPFFFVHRSKFRLRALALWLVLAAACVGYYFYGYAKPANHPPMSLALHDLKGAMNFMLSFLGNGVRLGKDLNTDISLGLVIVSAWGLGILYILAFGRNIQLWRKSLPWIMLGAYSIASAVLTTLGRFGFGPFAAITERYSTFAIPLWMAIVPLWVVIFCYSLPIGTWGRKLSMLVCAASGGAVAVVMIEGCLYIRGEMLAYYAQVLAGRSVAQFVLVAPDREAIMTTLFPDAHFAKQVIGYTDKADLFHPQCFRTNDISSIAADNNGVLSGYFDSMGPVGDRLVFNGWACIPIHKSPVSAVLLTTPDAAGVQRVFAIVCQDRLSRPDVAKAMDCESLDQTGWTKTIPSDQLPHGAQISAWAFDTFNRRAYQLAGTHVVP